MRVRGGALAGVLAATSVPWLQLDTALVGPADAPVDDVATLDDGDCVAAVPVDPPPLNRFPKNPVTAAPACSKAFGDLGAAGAGVF